MTKRRPQAKRPQAKRPQAKRPQAKRPQAKRPAKTRPARRLRAQVEPLADQIRPGTQRVHFQWLADRLQERPRTPAHDREGLRICIKTVPPGEPQVVVSLRNAIFMNYQPTKVTLDTPLEIRHLSYEGGEWMSDSPQEVWQMHDPLERLREMDEPELLVGGLGLGVFSHLAAEYAGVIATTIERDPRVIRAVGRHVAARCLVLGNIYEYAREVEPGEFNAAFLDTWQSTGEHCWVTEVVPLRRLLAQKIPEIWCWNEPEMHGQIRLSAGHAICVPLTSIPESSVHWRVLREAAERAGLVDPLAPMPRDSNARQMWVYDAAARLLQDPRAHALIERLLHEPGSPAWEAEFGASWDAAAAAYAAWQQEYQRHEKPDAAL